MKRSLSLQPTGLTARLPWTIWGIALLCFVPELLLLGADWGLWGSARWRPLAYQNGAFWAGLLRGWTPNYAVQPATMFLSYGWLHAGPGHLAGNLLVLVWLGRQVQTRMGPGRFLLLWAAGLMGGAAAFGLLTPSPAPMVGASGALFGLAGAWGLGELRQVQQWRSRIWRVIAFVIAIALLNAVAWVLQDGALAWETHLGGLLAGGAFAALWPRKG